MIGSFIQTFYTDGLSNSILITGMQVMLASTEYFSKSLSQTKFTIIFPFQNKLQLMFCSRNESKTNIKQSINISVLFSKQRK